MDFYYDLRRSNIKSFFVVGSISDNGEVLSIHISLIEIRSVYIHINSSFSAARDTGKTPRLKEVDTMKQRRQCSLEWELLATILDRILLFVFVFSVLIVTVGMMGTGYFAQLHYDKLAREQAKNG